MGSILTGTCDGLRGALLSLPRAKHVCYLVSPYDLEIKKNLKAPKSTFAADLTFSALRSFNNVRVRCTKKNEHAQIQPSAPASVLTPTNGHVN